MQTKVVTHSVIETVKQGFSAFNNNASTNFLGRRISPTYIILGIIGTAIIFKIAQSYWKAHSETPKLKNPEGSDILNVKQPKPYYPLSKPIYIQDTCTVIKEYPKSEALLTEILENTTPSTLNFSNRGVQVVFGEVQKTNCSFIMNAANTHLDGASGVDGAICQAAGKKYRNNQLAVRSLEIKGEQPYKNGYSEGHAVLVPAGNKYQNQANSSEPDKFTRYVVVVAAPHIGENVPTDEQKNQLFSCYYNSLRLVHEINKFNNDIPSTFAMVSLDTGVFGWTKDDANPIMVRALERFLSDYPTTDLKISIMLYSADLKDQESQNNFISDFISKCEMK